MAARIRIAGWFALSWLVEGVCRAGMPSITLADARRGLSLSNLTRMRLEAISFFLMGLLISAGVIQAVWNGLRTDFTRLPRLSYGKALGVVVLWGLLFVIVLTMISGARELMTPGAWEKKGWTYRLAEEAPTPVERQITARTEAIGRLRDALYAYAVDHEWRYPDPAVVGVIPERLWTVPASGRRKYMYVGGSVFVRDARGHVPLAYEPDVFGPDRLVILTDGSVRWMPAVEIERLVSRGEP